MSRVRSPTVLLLVSVFVVACGARSSNAPAPTLVEEPTCPDCFSERWEQPPPGIGQTPPEQTAPIVMVEDFENPARAAAFEGSSEGFGEGSGEGSGESVGPAR
jgi:hypothetical protein